MSWVYEVRAADPVDREGTDAHEVRALLNGFTVRLVGVWPTRGQATQVAVFLNAHADGQIR